MKTPITTDAAPIPRNPYSQGVVANGFLYTSGFGPVDPATGRMPDGIEAQTRQALRNVAAVLATAGLDLTDVVRVTTHLRDLAADFAGYNAAYAELVPAPYPVRTTVGSELNGSMLVEIDVVAALRE